MNYNWLDKDEYPFTSRYHDIDGHSMHYIEEGEGETILFVHGTPSWSFDFRHSIKTLRTNFKCMAIDHIGFGLSDKPKLYDYSTQNQSRSLERFVIEKDLKDITLVVHDFGGPIGLNCAMNHPDRIKRIVILNSWLWSSAADPDFKRLSNILKSPLLPFLYLYLNFSPKFILPGSFGKKKLPTNLLNQYKRPFSNRSERYGALAFAYSLLNDQEWFETLWGRKQVIASKPTLFVWGMKDPFIKPEYLYKFLSGFENVRTIELEGCGHFPQEEESEAFTNALLEFLKEH